MAHVFNNIKVNGLAIGRGFSTKRSVRVATTVAGTLASSFENGDTIDGIILATNDRILIKNQASAIENGIYIVQVAGTPIRAPDYDEGENVLASTISVEEGTNANTIWLVSGSGSVIVGTNNINYVNSTAKNIIVKEEGANIANTPHTALNFVGTRITATDGGGGTANIAVALPTTTKGDLIVYGTDDSRLPVGANNYLLTADSSQPLGVKWGPVTLNTLGRDLQQATSTVVASTTSTTFVDMPNMTLTTMNAGSSQYFVFFSAEITVSNSNRTVNTVLNINGVDETSLDFDIGAAAAGQYTVTTFSHLHSTPLGNGVIIKMRWRINGGGGTIFTRSRGLLIVGTPT